MATIGTTDGYYTDFVINPDYSLSYTFISTRQGGLPSPQTETAQNVQATIDFLLPYVTSHTYSYGTMQPHQAMVLTIAEQKSLVTAAQLHFWYQDNNMPVGGMKGYTSFDYDPAGPAVPSAWEMATSPSLLGVSTSDTVTINAVQQIIADISGAVDSLPTGAGFEKHMRPTRKAEFLARMETLMPWAAFCALVEPHYPKAGNGRPPVGRERVPDATPCLTSAACWRRTSWAKPCSPRSASCCWPTA